MNYREIKPEELSGNTFKMIGSDWMLVSNLDAKSKDFMASISLSNSLTLVSIKSLGYKSLVNEFYKFKEGINEN